jgi:hypothetical protein
VGHFRPASYGHFNPARVVYYVRRFHIALTSGRISKDRVDTLVGVLVHQPELVKKLFQLVLLEDGTGDFYASWTFDHLMRKKLEYLLPIFDVFVDGLSELKPIPAFVPWPMSVR